MHCYSQIIKEVKKINRQAALGMARKLPLLKMRGYMEDSFGPNRYQQKPLLASSFYWRATPQGHDYWSAINKQIRW